MQNSDLALLRQASGLTLDEIAESTKISVRFLSAIEENRLQELPGGVFARSYIRQYSQAIGCDPAPLLAMLQEPVPETPARQPVQRVEPKALLRFLSIG